MWPFGAKKHQASPRGHQTADPPLTARGKNLNEYLQYKKEDVDLQLSASNVKTLKKILYFNSAKCSIKRDFDFFVVSWDVSDLVDPPDDISPLLPPSTWGEPDIMLLGLQNCSANAASLWSLVVAKSIHRYSRAFKPIAAEAPYDQSTGSLILLFVRDVLLPSIHNYSSELSTTKGRIAGVAACRFGFHQTSVAVVCRKFPEAAGFSMDEPLRSEEEREIFETGSEEQKQILMNAIRERICVEAKARQRFAAISSSIVFDAGGKLISLEEHPLVFFIGMKDAFSKSEIEERHSRLAFLKAYSNMTRRELTVEKSAAGMGSTLENHSVDLRFSNRTPFVGGAGSSLLNFVFKKNKGNIKIMKAGIMRLLLEIVEADGGKGVRTTPKESKPELLLIRSQIPTVDIEALKHLYSNTWKIFKNLESRKPGDHSVPGSNLAATSSTVASAAVTSSGGLADSIDLMDGPALKIEPKSFRLTKPLSSFTPVVLTFRILNEGQLPFAFTICCLVEDSEMSDRGMTSDRGPLIVPIAKHSFLHVPAVSPNTNQPPPDEPPQPSVKKSMTEKPTLQTSKSSTKGLTNDVQKKVAKLTKIAHKNLQAAWGTEKTKKSKHSHQPPPQTPVPIEPPSSRLVPIQMPISDYDDEPPQPPPVVITTTPVRQIRQDISLTRWMLVDPPEGVVLQGESVDVKVCIVIHEGFLEYVSELPPVKLLVRVDEAQGPGELDNVVTIETAALKPSIMGLGPMNLMELGDRPLIDLVGHVVPQRNRRSSFSATMGPAKPTSYPPMPKEVWLLLGFIYQKLIYQIAPDDPSLPENWHLDTMRDVYSERWFDLGLFLIRSSRGWENADPSVRGDIALLKECLENYQMPPPSVSIEAALRMLEKWCTSSPVPLVPREYIAELPHLNESGGPEVHFLCRAALLSLPMVARNIFLCIMSLTRALLMLHYAAGFHITEISVSHLLQRSDLRSQTRTSGAYRRIDLGQAEKDRLLNYLKMDGKIKYEKLEGSEDIIDALTEWLARFLARDSCRSMSVPFVRHFLQEQIC